MENRHKTMSDLIRKKDPRMVRLGALKSYQKLSPEARKMVKAVILRDADPEMAGCGPNWRRIWDSQTVTDCLNDFGWTPPKRILPTVQPYQPAETPPVPELPCENCGTVGAHTSRHDHRLVCNACLCRASNILALAPPKPEKCWECGAEAQPTWDGRWLCPTHFASAASTQAQESSAEFAAAVARRNVLANQGRDINTCDLAAQRGMVRDDNFSRSVQIWQERDADAAERQAQESRERARLTEELNHRRADYISRHGMLAPHDKF